MSRGLGKLQRDILTACDEYRSYVYSSGVSRWGGAYSIGFYWRGGKINNGEQIVFANGKEHRARLAGATKYTPGEPIEAAIDIRAVSKWMAEKYGETEYGTIKPKFKASFSRALKTVIQRGYLVPDRYSRRFYRKAA
jgi:hypothetical protein